MKPWFTAGRDLLRAGLDLLYPPACPACGGDAPDTLCAACLRRLPRLEPPFCMRCSQPFAGALDEPFACANCGTRDLHFECAVSRYRAAGPVRDMIHRFKYNDARHLRRPLAGLLGEALDDPRLASRPFDAMVPVPLHPGRLRRRGYNQAALLAETLAETTRHPVLPALRRIRATRTQTHLDRTTRMENLRGAFVPDQNVPVIGLHLVVVDDVFTTGATTDACSRVLLDAGAASVRVVTAARG